MVGLIVFLSVVALGFATWGMSKFSKWLETRVRIWVFYSVMGSLMLSVGYGFYLCVSFANTLA